MDESKCMSSRLPGFYELPQRERIRIAKLFAGLSEQDASALGQFGALTRVFKEGNGLIFVDKEEDFIITLENVKSDVIDVKTREMVLPYSWGNITKKLEKIYVKVANGDVL